MNRDLGREFLAPSEGDLPAEAKVIRPSLWASAEAVTRLAAALAPFLLPLVLSSAVNVGGPPSDGPLILRLLGRYELVAGFAVVAVPVLRIAFTRYVVDSTGIRVTSSFLGRSEQRVPWEKVTALRHRRTLLGTLVGIESVDVVAYGARGTTLRLVGLRQAATLRNEVAQRMRSTASVAALVRND